MIAPSSLLFSLLARCSFPLHALIATDSVPIQFILKNRRWVELRISVAGHHGT